MESSNTKMQILNRDVIKYIAMFTMLLNHIAHMFMPPGEITTEIFMAIGYFTAPTMCYFMVEGYEYTRSKKKYGLRLLIFAVISQIPFSLAFHFGNLNMIYTLLCCFLILVVMDKVDNSLLRIILCMVLTFATVVGDWALFAPIFTMLFYNNKGNRGKLLLSYGITAAVFTFITVQSNLMRPQYTTVEAIGFGVLSVIGIVMSAVVILFLYNGKRAERGRNFSKWFFYIFYPGHLMVLYLVRIFMG